MTRHEARRWGAVGDGSNTACVDRSGERFNGLPETHGIAPRRLTNGGGLLRFWPNERQWRAGTRRGLIGLSPDRPPLPLAGSRPLLHRDAPLAAGLSSAGGPPGPGSPEARRH